MVSSLQFLAGVYYPCAGHNIYINDSRTWAACVSSWIKGREKHLIVVILNALNIDLDGIEKHLGNCLFYLKKPLSQAAAAQS